MFFGYFQFVYLGALNSTTRFCAKAIRIERLCSCALISKAVDAVGALAPRRPVPLLVLSTTESVVYTQRKKNGLFVQKVEFDTTEWEWNHFI